MNWPARHDLIVDWALKLQQKQNNIPLSSWDSAIITCSEFGARQSLDQWTMWIRNLLGLILLIAMFTQKFIKIFHSVQEAGLFSLFQNLTLDRSKPRPMINVILQSLGLDVVNINALRMQNFIKIFQTVKELWTFFTNRPGTKSSQTVRWQYQMFDYRALYESQPSVSVDCLRFVQCPVREDIGMEPKVAWKRYP